MVSNFLPSKYFSHFFSKLALGFIVLFLFSLHSGCSTPGRIKKEIPPTQEPIIQKKFSVDTSELEIRVLLDEFKSTLKYKVNTDVGIISNGEEIAIVKRGNTINAQLENGSITITLGRRKFESSSFIIISKTKTLLEYKNLKYRGEFNLTAAENEIYLINRLPLETYLMGVLPVEMGVKENDSYFEAMKAFAIVARTFAIMRLNSGDKYYDVKNDVRDQVYRGANFETKFDNKAIEETKSKVLAYNNELAIVFYSSSCGGYTENVGNVFSRNDINYLRTIKDGYGPNCVISPSFSWRETYSETDFINFLFNSKMINTKSKRIDDIAIDDIFESGRIAKLEILFTDGEKVFLNNRNIRDVIRRKDNGGILRSTNFKIDVEKKSNSVSKINLIGKGNGHGVGLCQWGSLSLSEQGKNFEEIIQFYFPGTVIESPND